MLPLQRVLLLKNYSLKKIINKKNNIINNFFLVY